MIDRYSARQEWVDETITELELDPAGDVVLYADYIAKLAEIRAAFDDLRKWHLELDLAHRRRADRFEIDGLSCDVGLAADCLDALLSEAE